MDDVTVVIPIHRDGNKEWLQQAIQSFPAGTPFKVAENDGELGEALNAAVAEVETEFFLPFGSDDVAEPGMLEMLRSLIWDVDVAYPAMILTDEELRPIGYHQADPFCPIRLLTWNYVSGAPLLRKSAVLAVGGWRELEGLEDWDLFVRMYRNGARFKPVPEAMFRYRQVPGSRNRQEIGKEPFEQLKARKQREIVGEVPKAKATFYYQATPATTYWRCQLPALHLPGRCLPDVALAETDEDFYFPEHEGTAVMQFAADASWAATLLGLQHKGYRVLVETDDNYLVSSPNRKKSGWEKKIGQGRHTTQGHKWIVEQADGVIVTTETLAKAYSKLNPNVYVCPNQIEPSDWREEWEKPKDGTFRVGWFASFSHSKDERLVRRALEWASDQPDVQVVTMGLDPGWQFRRSHIPWSNDLSTYRRNLYLLDVGLGPIVPEPWSLSRSDLKALEYSMGGAMSILSDVAPYAGWQDKALMATTPKEFLRHVQWAVKNQDEAREMGRAAREHVLKERTVEKNIWRWQEAIDP